LYHGALEPWLAAGIVAAALATYLIVPALVPRGAALVVAQAALVVVPVGFLAAARAPLRAALGLRGARLRWLAAAVAIGATLWYVNMRLVALLPVPARDVRALEQLVDQPPLGQAIALFALVPAICEEVLFRGVLARALGRHQPLALAAALSAIVFAAYHLSVVQALPTLTFGAALAVLAIRADSVLPAIVAHALNNAIAIAMSRGALPELAGWLAAHPSLALAGCATTSALGLAAAARGPT
jgi:sodium transport system permease protein